MCNHSPPLLACRQGFINGGQCLRMKDPLVGWDDCAEWGKLENVVLEGAGTLDANGDWWWQKSGAGRLRPMMLDLLWVDGLTIRDLHIRRPGFWTTHPCKFGQDQFSTRHSPQFPPGVAAKGNHCS